MPYGVPVRLPNASEIAWAAGLFTGEGNVGRKRSGGKSRRFVYLHIQMLMLDQRSITRFARLFGIKPFKTWIKARSYYAYRITACGRTAEKILSIMWPHLKGTDKGDQATRYARELRVFPWITGERTGLRRQLQRHKRGLKAK